MCPAGWFVCIIKNAFATIEARANLKDKRDRARIKYGFRATHDTEERHPWRKAHMHVKSLKPPPMASRDTQGPFINTVSVGIYGPTALYKLAQWGALNKLWTRRRAPEIRYRGWPSTITRTCAHLFPLSSLDLTRHGQGQDCIRSVRDSTSDTFHLIHYTSGYYLLIVSSQSMESKKLYI